MRPRVVALVLLLQMAAHPAARAATFTRVFDSQTTTVVLTGDIADGDAYAFSLLVDEQRARGKPIARLNLNSPGGRLVEAVRLATLVRRSGFITLVSRENICASACFMIFAAGRETVADYGSYIGVHGVADRGGRTTADSVAATISMARIVAGFGVPSPIVRKMVATPPNAILWLTAQDLRAMGTRLTGRPVQAPRGGPRPLGAPELQPSADHEPGGEPATDAALLLRAVVRGRAPAAFGF